MELSYMSRTYRYTYDLKYADGKWNIENWSLEETKTVDAQEKKIGSTPSTTVKPTATIQMTAKIGPSATNRPTQTPGPTHKSENTRETTISTKKPEETKIATGLEEMSEPKPEPSDPSNSELAVRPSEPPEPSASPKPETPDVTGHPSTVWVICSCGTMHEMTINGDPNVIKNCPGCGKAYSDSYVFDD